MAEIAQPEGRSEHVRQSLGSLAKEARDRSRLPRLLLQALIAAIAWRWIGPWALAWLAGIQLIERVVEPWILRAVLARTAARRALRAEWVNAGFRALTAIAFAASWAPAWAVGGDSAGFFAAIMLSGALIHALVYFSNSRVTFYAAIAPPILAGVVTPLWFHGLQASHLLVIPILGVALLRAHWAQRDQIALFESVDRNRARRKEAEEANRAKSAFMAAMTHELRTPLNAILNYAEMLEEDLAADGRQQLAADAVRIRRSGENLLSLVNAVLDYAMIEQGQLTPSPRAADIRALLEGEASALREAARARGNRIETCIAEGVGSFEVDADRLRQCVASLLSNACKFTQNGRITLRCNYEAGQLRIAVEDTGCGIGEEDAPKLFEPFSQADSGFTRASDGAGLGLAISRRLARLMGGDLVCRSAPGAGSVFTLTVAARELIRG